MKENEALFILRLWHDDEKWCASLKNRNKEVQYFGNLTSLAKFLQKWDNFEQKELKKRGKVDWQLTFKDLQSEEIFVFTNIENFENFFTEFTEFAEQSRRETLKD